MGRFSAEMFLTIVLSLQTAALCQDKNIELVVLSDCSAMIGCNAVRQLQRGQVVTAGTQQGGWLWISDEKGGWVTRGCVTDPEQAVRRFSDCITSNPRDPAAYVYRGNAKLACGLVPAAITDFNTALRIDPCCARALSGRRRAVSQAGQIGNAHPSRPAEAHEDDDPLGAFVVERNGDLLLIPVAVGGREYSFFLDTGTTTNVFDTSLMEHLTPTGVTSKLNETREVALYLSPGAMIGQLRRELDTPAICDDLSVLRDFTGHDVRGVIGMQFLRRFVVCIDFDAGHVSFRKSSDGLPGIRVPIEYSQQGIPTIACEVAGAGTMPFLLDTGSWGFNNGTLTPEVLGEMIGATGDSGPVLTFDGTRHVRSAAAGLFHIERTRHVHRDLEFIEDPRRNRLGLGYLSRYKVTFDFPNKSLLLEKSLQYWREFENQSGIAVGKSDGLFVVTQIARDELGELAGIREGDSISEIDGIDTHELTLYAARRLLHARGDGLRLTIRPVGGAESREIQLRAPVWPQMLRRRIP